MVAPAPGLRVDPALGLPTPLRTGWSGTLRAQLALTWRSLANNEAQRNELSGLAPCRARVTDKFSGGASRTGEGFADAPWAMADKLACRLQERSNAAAGYGVVNLALILHRSVARLP